MSVFTQKSLKQKTLALRDQLPNAFREQASELICSRLEQLDLQFQTPFVYVSFRSEVSTHAFIKKRLNNLQFVAVPKVNHAGNTMSACQIRDFKRDLAHGAFGILEPVTSRQSQGMTTPEEMESLTVVDIDPMEIDVIIAPGSVFDASGARHGYGGGYYDRFIAKMPPKALKIALAFEMQIAERLELEAHDQRMDYIITETRVIDCTLFRNHQ